MKRRSFIKKAVASTIGTIVLPTIVPSSVFGANAPSNKIQVGWIGCGRMGNSNMSEIMKYDQAQCIAVCDVDKNRMLNVKSKILFFISYLN